MGRLGTGVAVAVEDAGFELRDSIAWLYGSGFPKSLDVSKAIDKSNGKHEVDLAPFGSYVKQLREAKGWSRKQLDDVMGTNTAVSWWEGRASGVQLPSKETYDRLKVVLGMDGRFDSLIDWAEAEREVIGQKAWSNSAHHFVPGENHKARVNLDETAPATSEAKAWEGWGTALKPAHEPVVVGRKPFGKGVTVAENVLAWGVGGLNIDGSRIGTEQIKTSGARSVNISGDNRSNVAAGMYGPSEGVNTVHTGRWPANVILDEVTAGLLDEQSGVSVSKSGGAAGPIGFHAGGSGADRGGHNDSGGASRFFYVAKAI